MLVNEEDFIIKLIIIEYHGFAVPIRFVDNN
jgi:hypothetical protein